MASPMNVEKKEAECETVERVLETKQHNFPQVRGVPVLNAGPFVGSRRKSDHRMKNAS